MEAKALTKDDDNTGPQFEPPALEMGIRLINRLVANGTLTEAEAAEVYARTLASISDPAQRAATMRIFEAWGAQHSPQ